jgi:hypothetical protein
VLTSLNSLLSKIVDYAGLFPPAQLSLSEAMVSYDRTQAARQSWMLDRFVLPASRFPEFMEQLPIVESSVSPPSAWKLSVLLSQNWRTEIAAIQHGYRAAQDLGVVLSAFEIAPLELQEILAVCEHLPPGSEAFFEIPFEVDMTPYFPVLKQTHQAVKLRTGGMTQAAFPTAAQLSQRVLALAEAQIPFKTTAGLHHPLRGCYPLTNAPNSPVLDMHGFFNLSLLAALALQNPLSQSEAIALLAESTIAPFQMTDTEIRWRDRTLTLTDIGRSRQTFFRSFGSCSIQDPIADLQTLHLLDPPLANI